MKVLVEENVRILIVDDDESIVESYRKTLRAPEEDTLSTNLASLAGRLFSEPIESAPQRRQDFTLQECYSGEDAMLAVERAIRNDKPFSVIFLDFILPGMDGIETAAKIRRLDPAVELVLVTGRSDLNVETLSQEVPPVNKFFYFQKPFNSGELRHLTRALTEKWKTERELKTLQDNLEDLVEKRTNELMRANRGLEKAKVEVASAVQVKRDFLATMSHEMRTPLNAILGFSELVQAQDIPDYVQDYVENIHRAGCDLLTIITDILDFSNLAQGKVLFERELVDLSPLIETVYNKFIDAAEARGIALEVNIGPNCHGVVNTSAWGLQRVLESLVSNAVKFTKVGSAQIKVSRDDNSKGEACLKFEVIDTGIGITDDCKPTIFSEFSQADSSASRRYDGIGLGLAICKQVFLGMDYEFGFESEVDAGSTFWFKLPQ